MALSKIQAESMADNTIHGRRNVLINGGMYVSQRYGETATTFTNNSYGLDRWKHYLAGSCASTFQQIRRSDSVVTNLQSVSGVNFSNAIKIDCTTAASLGSTDQMSILQIIEGTNNIPLAGKQMTLSFWVRSSVTGTYCIIFKNSSAKSYVHEYTISSADTWENKTITITNDTEASYSANSSTTTNGSLQVHFGLRLGTSEQVTTANAWNTGNFYGTSNQVTWGVNTNNFFYLAGVQLELGSVATPFEHRSFGEELALCQRYFIKTNPEDATRMSGFTGVLYTATQAVLDFVYPVEMRAAATSVTIGGTNNNYWIAGINGAAAGTVVGTQYKKNMAWWELGSVSSSGNGYQITYNGQVSINAEL